MCPHVPTERDKYVWLVQSRRRPEKWTRTRKADSRGSATPDPVSWSCVVYGNHFHKTTLHSFSCVICQDKTSRGVPSQGRHRSKVCACRRWQEPRLTAGTMRCQRVKEDLLVAGIMCLFTLPSQDQPLEHKWTLPSSMTTTSPSCLSMRCRSLRMRFRGASLVSSVKTRSVQDTFHDACFCLTHHVSFSRSGDRVRGARFCRHLQRALSSDRVRGACTCRHPCSAFSSNRIRGTYTCCHLRSDFFSDRVRGVRTCCLPCRTSDTD